MALNSDFAFEGLRIIRERPQLVIYWSLLSLLKLICGLSLISYMAGPAYMEQQNMLPDMFQHMNDPAFMDKMASLSAQTWPASILVLAESLIFDAVLYTAIFRAVLKTTPYRYGYLSVGKAEIVQILVTLTVLILMMIIFMGLMFLIVLISAVTQGIPGLMVVASFVSLIGIMFALIWALVRLSLSWVASFIEGSVNITESVRLTNNQTWPLSGGYALAIILGLLVGALVQIIFALLVLAVKGQGLSELASAYSPDLSHIGSLLEPATMVYILAGAILSPLVTSLIIGATAAAYKQLKEA